MMKKILIITGTTIWLAAGCAEERLEPGHIPLGIDFELPKGEKAFVDGFGSKLTVEVNSLFDSRCPANAICIWEGNFGADVTISDATQSMPVSLCNLFCGSTYTERDSVDFTLNEQDYTVILKDIQPYPGTAEDDEPRKVVLEIIKRGS